MLRMKLQLILSSRTGTSQDQHQLPNFLLNSLCHSFLVQHTSVYHYPSTVGIILSLDSERYMLLHPHLILPTHHNSKKSLVVTVITIQSTQSNLLPSHSTTNGSNGAVPLDVVSLKISYSRLVKKERKRKTTWSKSISRKPTTYHNNPMISNAGPYVLIIVLSLLNGKHHIVSAKMVGQGQIVRSNHRSLRSSMKSNKQSTLQWMG